MSKDQIITNKQLQRMQKYCFNNNIDVNYSKGWVDFDFKPYNISISKKYGSIIIHTHHSDPDFYFKYCDKLKEHSKFINNILEGNIE